VGGEYAALSYTPTKQGKVSTECKNPPLNIKIHGSAPDARIYASDNTTNNDLKENMAALSPIRLRLE